MARAERGSPDRRRRRVARRRLRGEDAPLDDRKPMHGQQVAQRREELEGVVTDDLEPPTVRPRPGVSGGIGVGRPGHRDDELLVVEPADELDVLGHFHRREGREIGRRERVEVVPHPGLGVESAELGFELGAVGHGQQRQIRRQWSSRWPAGAPAHSGVFGLSQLSLPRRPDARVTLFEGSAQP